MENNRQLIRQQSNKPLWEEILKFSRGKYWLAVILVIIGIIGFVVPVIPGMLLILMAVALFKPGLMSKIRRSINSVFKRK